MWCLFVMLTCVSFLMLILILPTFLLRLKFNINWFFVSKRHCIFCRLTSQFIITSQNIFKPNFELQSWYYGKAKNSKAKRRTNNKKRVYEINEIAWKINSSYIGNLNLIFNHFRYILTICQCYYREKIFIYWAVDLAPRKQGFSLKFLPTAICGEESDQLALCISLCNY